MGKAIYNPLLQGKIWKKRTGNLVYMTSDTTPAPYVATKFGQSTAGFAYGVFDTDINTSLQSRFQNGTYGATLKLAYPILISKVYHKHRATGQGSWTYTISAKFKDGTSATIATGGALESTDTVAPQYANKEVVEVTISTLARVDLILDIYALRIVEWSE